MRYFGEMSDGSYWLINQTYSTNSTKTELAILKETTYGELPPREHLTFGSLYVNANIRQAIVDFNKTNGKYRIRIEEFYNGEDWEAGQIAFNTALTRTNAPDLIDLTSANFAQLAAKKALEDLNPHFDKSELNRADYLESAFNAYTVAGKLYAAMTEFSLGTLVGHASKLEGIDSWNMTEMIEWAKRYPEAQLMNSTSTSILYELVFMSLDKFIDWESGKCDFTSDEFIEILDFAATFGDDYDSYDYNDPDRIGTHEGLQTGKYLLLSNNINDLNAMQMMDAMFDGEPKYIGYPTESGSGIFFSPSGALCISAKSKHKEGAFAFISYLLSDAYQKGDENGYRYGIPVNKAAIEAMIVTATTPLPGETATTSVNSWGWDDLNVQIFAAKNANYVDTFWDLLNRASGYRGGYETQINTIIQEETEAFFAGQKTAQEVAEIVQSRVQIYVNELQ
jgi:ABC-type glycerol-3-phosphate transport system substrate-binding protein